MFKTLVLSTALLGATAGLVHAQALKPIQGLDLDLGAARGSAFYVPLANGYRVVATLDTGTATPIRFDTTLAKGQSATVSVPAALGATPVEVTFVGTATGIEMRKSTAPSDAVTASTR